MTDIAHATIAELTDAGLVVAISRYQPGSAGRGLPAPRRRRATGWPGACSSDDAQAEEIVQEVFLRLWDQPEKFDPGRGSLRSLPAGPVPRPIGRPPPLRRRRAAAARSATCGAPPRPATTSSTRCGTSPWPTRMEAALGALPDGERRAIELAYYGGHSYREVAELLGEPEGTVKSRIRAGLRRLRSELADAGLDRRQSEARLT